MADQISHQADCVVFKRRATNHVMGCLAYALSVPMAAGLVGLFVIIAVYALLISCGMSYDRAFSIAWPFGVLGIVGVFLFGFRDYRRRAGSQVVLGTNHLACAFGRKGVLIAYADVQGVDLLPRMGGLACRIRPQNGRPLVLPYDIASYRQVREPLKSRLLPLLVSRMEESLDDAGAICLRDGFAALCTNFLLVIGDLFLAVLSLSSLHLLTASNVMRRIPYRLRQCRYALSSGLVMTQDGVGPYGSEAQSAWADIQYCRCDDVGVIIRTRTGQTMVASAFAPNYWPTVLLLAERINDHSALACGIAIE